jgi:hypothetical protein
MLLHIGAFETMMLPTLLEILQEKGFVLTTLEDAQTDPAYATVPVRESNWNGTLLRQLRPPRQQPARAAKSRRRLKTC